MRDAAEIATDILQSYIDPDHKVLSMQGLYRAIVQAIQDGSRRRPIQEGSRHRENPRAQFE
jgi:hypothetical protein